MPNVSPLPHCNLLQPSASSPKEGVDRKNKDMQCLGSSGPMATRSLPQIKASMPHAVPGGRVRLAVPWLEGHCTATKPDLGIRIWPVAFLFAEAVMSAERKDNDCESNTSHSAIPTSL